MNLLKPQQDSEPEEALETAMAMVASALSDSSRVSIPVSYTHLTLPTIA